jgi:hypothetical protein
LLPLSQLLFLFFENRFRAVMRSFSVCVQSRYSFSSESACRIGFPARDRMPPGDGGCSTEPTPFPIICSAHPSGSRDRLVAPARIVCGLGGACTGRSAGFSPLRMRPVGIAGYRLRDFGPVSLPSPGDRHDSPRARSLRAG